MAQHHSRDRPDIIADNLKIIFHEDASRALPPRLEKLIDALKAKEAGETTTEKQGQHR